jgi:hypothetical protein
MEVVFFIVEFLNIVGWQKPNLNIINKICIHVAAAKTRNCWYTFAVGYNLLGRADVLQFIYS